MEKVAEQKKQARKYILWGVAALAVLALAVMPMLAAGKSGDETAANILTAAVEKRSIEKQLIGGGQLSSDACLNVSIPENVKLTAYLVGNGDVVSEGDAIASVDKVSVMTAITQVQETLDYLSGKITSAGTEQAATSVTALAGGIVKVVYAETGDSVQDVMLEHGALAVLSLDGKMEVKISCESDLKSGDSVTATFRDGDTACAAVKSNLDGVLTVSMDDDDYDIGASVTLNAENGRVLGTGELYVSSPWNVTAYSGSVSSIRVGEGDTVSVGQTLFSLTDTGVAGEYQQLIDQRQKYEELIQELFRMYRTGTIAAPCDGIVTGVDSDAVFLLSSEGNRGIANFMSFLGNETSQQEGDCRLVLLAEVEYLNEGECTAEADCPAETHDPNCKALCDGTQTCTAINHKEGCLSQTPEEPPTRTVSIVTASLSDGVVGQSYTTALQASDGTDVLSGNWGASGLPEGLLLDADSGVISGTPAEAGSFQVTVSFTYNASTITKDYTLSVMPVQATDDYRGYVAQITGTSDGRIQVKQTPYSYPIADLDNLPAITIDQNALTQDAAYPAEETLSVNDYVLIILDSDGIPVKIVKQDMKPEAGQGGAAEPDANHGGQGGGASSPGGGAVGGGTGQAQTFTLYTLDRVTVASVTSQEQMGVSISIDELDITKIYVGQEATVSVDALGGEQFDAAVTGIANSGSNSGGNSKFSVELTLKKSGDMLPGMYCSAFITLNTAEDALCIPVAALSEDGDDTIVYTGYDEENGLGNPVTVTVGVSDGENVEILSGLNPGQTCYYSYYDTYVKANSQQPSVSFSLMGTGKNRGRE